LPWTRNTVREILTNPRYTGDAVWNMSHQGKYHRVAGGSVTTDTTLNARESRRRRQGLRGLPRDAVATEDVIIKQNAHPAIVEREAFGGVQEKLARNRKRTTPIRGGGDWKLTGLLFCGDCGSAMWGMTDRRRERGKTYVYRKYECSGNRRHGQEFCWTLGGMVKSVKLHFRHADEQIEPGSNARTVLEYLDVELQEAFVDLLSPVSQRNGARVTARRRRG
jgi:hypothetical protein